MLRMRLRRTGAKKKPNYRVVIADARSPRDGAFLDIVGHYNPLTEPSTVVIHREKAEQWLAKGAQPSDRVTRLLVREGILPASAHPYPGAAAAVVVAAPEPVAEAPEPKKPARAPRARAAKAAPADEAAPPADAAPAAEAAAPATAEA